MLCCRELSEGDSEMVGVVESVKEILMKGVNILQSWETFEDSAKFFGEGLLGIFYFSGVES